MTHILQICGAGGIGAGLGFFYFSGLWRTLQGLSTAHWPALWVLISFLFRMSCLLMGFLYLMTYGEEIHLLAAILGFWIIRKVLTQRWGTLPNQVAPPRG